jgi:APA family basic amino acid/polyamine antiporter
MPTRVAAAAAPGQAGLLRVLGLVFGLAMGVGTMIGGGILRAPGSVLDQVPVPIFALALWALAALHALISANVIAEVMTALPRSGGLFVPAQEAFGRPGGLLIGWTDWLIQTAAIAALSIATGEFAALIIPSLHGQQGIVGAALTLGLFLINFAGVREGSAVQIAGTFLKAAFLVGLAVAVVLAPGSGDFGSATRASSLSLWKMVVAYQLIVGVYSGWPNPAYFSEEDREPSKNIPRALFLSISAVALLYLLVNAALIFALPLAELRTSELPMALAISKLFGALSVKIVAAAAIIIVASCTNANIMVGSRILYGLSREGLFPTAAERVNKGGTPYVALALTMVLSLALTLSGKFELMFLIMGALSLLPLVVAEAALFRMRRTSPGLSRPFKAIGYPLLPLLALMLDGGVLVLFIASDWKSGLSIIAAVAVCIPLGFWMQKRSVA